ncbi:MAG: hypothetical protein MMC23_007711 [Stictis urceolatum]|nr:hypothetical protein [Stictis urceolata]
MNGINGTSLLSIDGQYSVPNEAEQVFRNGILRNPLIQKHLPPEAEECSKSVRFEGHGKPSVPINWRFAESISSLHGLEATLLNVLLLRKYGITPKEVRINTDHAQLFFMSPLVIIIDPKGKHLDIGASTTAEGSAAIAEIFPDCDLHRVSSSEHRKMATNIYPTKDGRHYHIHGSMNPDPTLVSLSLPSDSPATDPEEAKKSFFPVVAAHTAAEYDTIANDEYRQAGTICWTTEEYLSSAHSQANAHVGLYDIHHVPNPSQSPAWWPSSPQTSAARPLVGLKVVDLTRVIASPAISRGLADLGASVMRITAPHITDMSMLHPDLNQGKWNAHLDLREESDREKLRALILDADVFLVGYRPGVLDKYGFGKDDVLEMCKSRGRGIIYARENCYGWNGPWAERSGWQQISDACCGVSMEFGRAMGLEEPVTPVFPNSDYCTGVCGVVGLLTAVLRRAEEGGSFVVDLALNYYSRWLVESVGMYEKDVWEDVWKRNGKRVWKCHDNMGITLPVFYGMLMKSSGDVLFRPEFFEDVMQGALGIEMRKMKSVLQYVAGEVKTGYNVGTRGNGVDQPRWPEDLMTEVVK